MTEIKIKKSTFYILGIIVLMLIAGFFFLKSGDPPITGNVVSGNANGDFQKVVISMKNYNYYPNTIKVKAGSPVSISLDESVYGCFRDFTIREFGVREYLKTPQDTVEFTPTKKGTYTFACSMGMGTGILIAE
jgi:plastocyanin domain-containing protein